jgi:AcrR family transcriptional regulator
VTASRRSYHHGDLRAALIDTAVELIAERGVRDFSMAEASRRTGVAASAPYAHFADRDALLAAVAVHGYELFRDQFLPDRTELGPGQRLAELAEAYVRFAATHEALFATLFEAGLDKTRHPEIKAAEAPIDAMFTECVQAVLGTSEESAVEDLAAALEATAHGHATLLLDGRFGEGAQASEEAAERAGRAVLALIDSRDVLSRRPLATRSRGMGEVEEAAPAGGRRRTASSDASGR